MWFRFTNDSPSAPDLVGVGFQVKNLLLYLFIFNSFPSEVASPLLHHYRHHQVLRLVNHLERK